MRSLLGCFGLTTLLAWTAWITASQIGADVPRAALFLLGTFAPGIVAIGFTHYCYGRDGVSALLQRLLIWQVPPRWYVFALVFLVMTKLTVAIVHRGVTSDWPTFGVEPWYLMLAVTALSTLLGGQAGEEIGWRGYALPRLTRRFGLGVASVLLGIVWACWHLPLFLIAGTSTTTQSFPLYLLQVTALSVVLAWLYARSGASLLLVMLMHAAVNNTKDIVPSADPLATSPWALSHSLPAWLTVALLWICAGLFLWHMRTNPHLERNVLDNHPRDSQAGN